MTANDESAERWQERYRELQRNADRREGEWQQVARAMAAVITRLSDTMSLSRPGLDAALRRVTDALVLGDARRIDASLHDLAATLATESAPAEGSGDTEGVLTEQRLVPLINELLQKLDLGAESAHAIGELVARMDRGVDADDWPGVFAEVARLIDLAVASLESKNRELEGFLRELGMQLGDIRGGFTELEMELLAARDDVARLVARVEEELDTLDGNGSGATGANRPDTLAAVRAHLRSGLEEQEGRAEQAEATLAEWLALLEELQRESSVLRGRLNRPCQQLLTDMLTGIPGRFAYHERLQREYTGWRRYRRPLGYVLLEVDGFGALADQFGHRVGDRLLQQIARTMADRIRRSDFIARIGGAQFALLLPETGTGEALKLADKLRESVGADDFGSLELTRQVTLSAGVTQFRGDDTVEQVYQRADAALYRARREGGDRSVEE